MDQAQLDAALAPLPLNKIVHFASTGSTNDVVAEWAAAGVQAPALAVAEEQTRGRGRGGRNWFTPPGAALAFSVLLAAPERLQAGEIGLISGLGALAVCRELEQAYGLSPQIKWPNDVLLSGQKCCGVLAEAHWQAQDLAALILGIGINVAPSSVPPEAELSFPATCVEAALGRGLNRLDLLSGVVDQVLLGLPTVVSEEFVQVWEARLAYKGSPVRLERPSEAAIEGQLLGLAPGGALRLRLKDGREQSFQVGEIRLRRLGDSAAK